jgi:heme oxygenase
MKPKSTPGNTSAKQLAANRRNAKKSTGPRTPQGRAVSRMNALKHGILSRQVLVRGQSFEEDEAELESLHLRFWEELQPVGPLEEMLVDQIVTAHWRLRRALRAESGEIALSVDTGQRRRQRGTDPLLQWRQWQAFGDVIHAMEGSALGCAVIMARLAELRVAVETEGSLTAEAVGRLAASFGGKVNSLVCQLDEFRLNEESASPDVRSPAEKKAAALAFLDRRITDLKWRRQCLMEEDLHEQEARQAAAVLPSGEVLEKILRYETKLERQLYRAMAQLERVQRLRNGENIPAPLSVQVSERA